MRLGSTLRRSAFSLMEMMCALTLGMLLLLALYFTLSTHFANAQAGRDLVAESTLARNLLARVSEDIAGQLGATDKRGLVDPNATTTTAAPTTTTPTDPTATPAAGAAPMTVAPTPVVYNFGISGNANTLTLSNYRVEKPRPDAPMGAEAEVTSDLRTTVYWLAMNGPEPLGLARAEFKQATSTDIDSDPTALQDQEKYVIAREVKSVTFEYFNGASLQWQTEWDGADDGDGGAATGPPAAIRVTITLRRMVRGMPATDASNDSGPTYQIIVAIPASNSFPPPTTTN